MGSFSSKVSDFFKKRIVIRIKLVGLDNGGKTTILYKLSKNETVQTQPTNGFNFEVINFKNICFLCSDVGGDKRIQSLWHYYFINRIGLIYVIDSSDFERLQLAQLALFNLLKHEDTANCPLLIFANKQDIARFTVKELVQILDLNSTGRVWKIQPCIATKGIGLFEGLSWLAEFYNK